MLKVVLSFAAAAFILAAAPASACQFDIDCGIGSTCVKKAHSLYGICAGGSNPGNSNDRKPVYAPLDPNRTYGNTCSSSADCGTGSRCVKQAHRLKGVCVR